MTVTRTYYLELNSVPLATHAWECPDLSPLLDDPTLRGTDVVAPYDDGVIAFRRRITATIVTLALDVTGDTDDDGNVNADPFEGLLVNFDYLKANLGLAEDTGDGTVLAAFHRGDLPTLYARVHFLGFKGTNTFGVNPPRLIRTTFDLSIPEGGFTLTGS
jgi:hypothetical protein